jgi:hypothetical protein
MPFRVTTELALVPRHRDHPGRRRWGITRVHVSQHYEGRRAMHQVR